MPIGKLRTGAFPADNSCAMLRTMVRLFPALLAPLLGLLALLLAACATGSGQLSYASTTIHSAPNPGESNGVPVTGGPSPAQRAAAIAAEPRGNYWIGRRYHVDRLRFWGYLRRPGQSWNQARLVIMDEDIVRVPDRLPERGSGLINGYDNNFEYRITGNFNGETAYDPLSNLALPVFSPTSFELTDRQPGWLFAPSERYNLYEITIQPPGGIRNKLER